MTKIQMGMFGKHSAWDDFLWYGGDKSAHIDTAMSLLYEEAINRNIESAAWGDPTSELETIVSHLDHFFLWHSNGKCLLGRWWPSRDRVGRVRPFGICAVPAVAEPIRGLVHCSMPLMDTFRESADQCDDKEILIEKLASLEAEIEACCGRGDGRMASDTPACCAWLREKVPEELLSQVLMAVCRALSPHMAASPQSPIRRLQAYISKKFASMVEGEEGRGNRARKIRLPFFGGSLEDVLANWWGVLEILGGTEITFGVFIPASRRWTDVIIGAPHGKNDFRFLGIDNIPLVTERAEASVPAEFETAVQKAVASGDLVSLMQEVPDEGQEY